MQKIGIFPKGLVHGVGQNFYFFLRFVLSKFTQKKYLVTLSLENKCFYTIKTCISKEANIGIFAKGIVHDVGQKGEVFSSFLLLKNRSRKSVC